MALCNGSSIPTKGKFHHKVAFGLKDLNEFDSNPHLKSIVTIWFKIRMNDLKSIMLNKYIFYALI